MKTFIIQPIYEEKKSEIPAEARSVDRKSMKKKLTLPLCLINDTINHLCDQATYLLHIQLHPEV